jgi:hypothetical protein
VLRAVSADFGKEDVQALGANAGSFRQYFCEIAFAQGEAAEASKRRLLAKKPLDIPGGFIGLGRLQRIARGRGFEHVESVRERSRGIAGGDQFLDELQSMKNVRGSVGFAQARVAIGLGQADLTDVPALPVA